MSTTFKCASEEGCTEEIELTMHHLPARSEAYRLGWRFRGSKDGMNYFCPRHTPPPRRH